MSVPEDYLKLVPVLRPYFHQITGVVWAASWRRDIRKGIFHDSLFPIEAVGTENVSFQKPVSFGLWPVARSDCLGDLLRAVQPPAQFLGSVRVDNFDLIFTTVVVRHVFFPLALGMGSEVPDFPTQIYAWQSGQSMPQTLCRLAASAWHSQHGPKEPLLHSRSIGPTKNRLGAGWNPVLAPQSLMITLQKY